MSGPTKKYKGGNVNFLIELPQRKALDHAAEQDHVRRSDIMRRIVAEWYEREGYDFADTEAA